MLSINLDTQTINIFQDLFSSSTGYAYFSSTISSLFQSAIGVITSTTGITKCDKTEVWVIEVSSYRG